MPVFGEISGLTQPRHPPPWSVRGLAKRLRLELVQVGGVRDPTSDKQSYHQYGRKPLRQDGVGRAEMSPRGQHVVHHGDYAGALAQTTSRRFGKAPRYLQVADAPQDRELLGCFQSGRLAHGHRGEAGAEWRAASVSVGHRKVGRSLPSKAASVQASSVRVPQGSDLFGTLLRPVESHFLCGAIPVARGDPSIS